MKIGVDFTRLNEARFALRAAEIAARLARRDDGRLQPAIRTEVNNAERELGPATGDLRQADQ